MDKYLHTSFHALGDPTRLSVIERLLQGPASVSELAEPYPMALPAFTKHLGILERAGLIRSKKKGRVRTCYIHRPAIREIDHWLRQRQTMWEERLDRLACHVDGTKKG